MTAATARSGSGSRRERRAPTCPRCRARQTTCWRAPCWRRATGRPAATCHPARAATATSISPTSRQCRRPRASGGRCESRPASCSGGIDLPLEPGDPLWSPRTAEKKRKMTAYFIVRAEVNPAARDAFDAWYETEHLPDAVAALGASGASRGWSAVRGKYPYRLLRVSGSGGGEADDGVRRAQGHDRRVQPPLGRQGSSGPATRSS